MKELNNLAAEANGEDSRFEGNVVEGITGGVGSGEGRGGGETGAIRNSFEGGGDGGRDEKVNRIGVLV